MRINERDYLIELQKMLSRIPPPSDGSGAASTSITGYIQYGEDMQTLIPMIQRVLMGIVTIDNIRRHPDIAGELEEGWDYHEPSLVLCAIEKWIELRISQNWENANRYELKGIYEGVRRTKR